MKILAIGNIRGAFSALLDCLVAPHGAVATVGPCQQNNPDTDTNHRTLLDPYTRYHAALEYAFGTHPQCFARRVRARRCRTFQKDAAPRTARPWAAGIRTGTSPPVLCLTAA